MMRLREFVKNETGMLKKLKSGIASVIKAVFIVLVLVLLLMLIAIFVIEFDKLGLLRVVPKPLRALIEPLKAVLEPLRAVLENLIGFAGVIIVFRELSQNKRINEAQLIKELNCEFINNSTFP